MNRRGVPTAVAVLACVLMLLGVSAWRLRGGAVARFLRYGLAIDSCLDSGGVWDAERKRCERQEPSR